LKDAQRRVDEWISQFEEGYWPPLDNLARLLAAVRCFSQGPRPLTATLLLHYHYGSGHVVF
jgi:hypothetical protein